ncbi:aspartic-type endopeptidase [Seiridium cupressi]
MQLYLASILGLPALGLGASVSSRSDSTYNGPLFSRSDISIAEAPSEGLVQLNQNPKPDHFRSPVRSRIAAQRVGKRAGMGNATVNTLFSGIYPTVNLTWGNTDGSPGQQFISFIDTGSSDSWVVSSDLQCVDIETKVPLSQDACGFGPLYDSAAGSFTNITDESFSISYFPEGEALKGDMVYAPITLGGLTVSKQQVALVNYAAWIGDDSSSGLLGLGYPAITSGKNRTSGRYVEYDPLFTTMIKENVVSNGIFTLVIDRVPQGTSPLAPAGLMALGGLVPASYYEAPFTSVPIVKDGSEYTWYTVDATFKYGTNGSITEFATTGSFETIVDSGTSPNFIPTAAAKALNAQFDPPAVYNATLDYYVVDCDATAPYAAYVVGGVEMPMDPQDMIVRSLNGLPGYEDVCFSAFADGGPNTPGSSFIIGAVWQRSYVVAYDQTRSMMHFAKRTPY